MKKNLLALAVAGAFAAPAVAFAQSTFVQIYGTFNVDGQYARADDPGGIPGAPLVGGGFAGVNGNVLNGTTRPLGVEPLNNSIPGQWGVSSNSSNIGFRGNEDLGGGLKAIFQLESSITLDAGGGNLGGRNSNVGLAGHWGTVFYGLWDTPYKSITGGRVDPSYATTAAAFNSVYGSPGYNVRSATVSTPSPTAFGNPENLAGFDRRQTNSVQYWTPNFAGFSGRLQYSPGELKGTVTPTGYVLPQTVNPWMWSVSGTYENGPIYVGLGYEQHNDYFGTRVFTGAGNATGNSSEDWGAKAVIGVQNVLGGLSVYGIYERLKYSTDGVVTTGQLTDYRRDAFGVMGNYQWGNFIFGLGWMRAMDPDCSAIAAICLDEDLATDQYSARVAYLLSKRTQVYLYATKQANDSFARYKLGTNTGPVPAGGNTTVGIGTEPEAIGLGIRHTF